MANTVNTRIILRNDTLENWLTSSTLIYKGEAALALGTNGKYEIRIGTSTNGSTWNSLSSNNLEIPAANVIGLNDSLYDYQLTSISTIAGNGLTGTGSFKLLKRLHSSTGDWTDVTTVTINFADATTGATGYSATNPIALKAYVDEKAAAATNNTFVGIRATASTSDEDAISTAVGAGTPKGGDICIIKTALGGTSTEYSYKAFVYNANVTPAAWTAMDGNYDWNTVYATENLTVTKAVGTITIPSSGSTTFNVAGKTVKLVFEKLLAQELYPTVSHPSVSLTSKKDGSNYTADTTVEAGTSVTFGYTTSLNAGSYTYGPATGVTAQSYSVALKKGDTTVETKTSSTDSFTAVTIKDAEVYKIVSTINHNAGATPVTNLGSDATTTIDDCLGTKISGTGTGSSNPISATSKSATGKKITGYSMGVWYGTLTSVVAAADITSANVRGLLGHNNATAATGTFNMTVPVGAETIVIAAKGTRTLTQVLNTTVNADMTTSFVKNSSVSVCGADAPSTDNATNYTVWTYSPAEAYGSTAALTIKIA